MSRFINAELKSDWESSDIEPDSKKIWARIDNLVLILNKTFHSYAFAYAYIFEGIILYPSFVRVKNTQTF